MSRSDAGETWAVRDRPVGGALIASVLLMTTRALYRGLGWFSVALGLTELALARPLARLLGVESAGLLRAFGVRDVASGIGLLTQARKGPWIWARIGGDALDVAVLGHALSRANPRRGNAALALAFLAPVIAADIVCGQQLRQSHA